MPRIPVDPQACTPEWFSEILHADVDAARLEQIAVGVGLLSRLFRVHLEGGPGVPDSVVVKLPTLDTTARTNLCERLEFYLREVHFYDEIGLTNPLPPARPYFVAFDESTHDFVLVLEDLGRLRLADQVAGCTAEDAEAVIDAIAAHQAYWWDNERLTSLPWLKPYNDPEFSAAIIANYSAAWPKFVERLGFNLSPAMRDFGERFLSLMPWFLDEFARPPVTFLHGDLRLDQLFFGVSPGDAPLTVVDWQITAKGRGAYDVGYFLTQSLSPATRRDCEHRLLDQYGERLAEQGIVYSPERLRRDYQLTTAWCFIYPVMAEGRIEVVNDRNLQLTRTMLERAAAAIEDHGALYVGPE